MMLNIIRQWGEKRSSWDMVWACLFGAMIIVRLKNDLKIVDLISRKALGEGMILLSLVTALSLYVEHALLESKIEKSEKNPPL